VVNGPGRLGMGGETNRGVRLGQNAKEGIMLVMKSANKRGGGGGGL